MANKKSTNSKKSSTNKTAKKAIKTAKKMAKKNPTAFIIIVIVLIVLIALGVGGYFVYTKVIAPKKENETSQNVSSQSNASQSSVDSSNQNYSSYPVEDSEGLDIYFLELGNRYTGDSTFIKAGNVDILIDAGSRKNSSTTIHNFIKQYCTDGVLEYVIATHAHEDHISGFVGSNSDEGIFKRYKIDTLIDFSLTNATSVIYQDYVSLRDAKVASGDIAHHYTANECVQQTNGAQKVYTLSDGITMEILDQKFYREKTNSTNENDFSVCTMFTQGENHYLFTGDLEEKGEASLVELNDLPKVELFKGGHHGSYTASSDTLLNVIQPKTVCICCCAGTKEYTKELKSPHNFPAQEAIDRYAKWTDQVFVTTLMVDYDNNKFESMNGNINFHCEKGKEYTVTGSNNSVILKDTDWFKNNRTWPSY